MKLASLIRKGGLTQIATATQATGATDEQKNKPIVASVATVAVATSGSVFDQHDWQTYYDKRYEIALYDGKQTETKANERAWQSCIVEWQNQNSVSTDSTRCAECGISHKAGATIHPFGGGDHYAWLHSECWKVWQNERYKQAEEALKLMDVVRKTQ